MERKDGENKRKRGMGRCTNKRKRGIEKREKAGGGAEETELTMALEHRDNKNIVKEIYSR